METNAKIYILSQSAAQKTTPSQKARKLETSQQAGPALPATLPVPSPAMLTRWTPEDIPSGAWPPLPPVKDPRLEQGALTHAGMITKATDMSYERLEWIGDSYLYLISTAFISQTFPNLTPVGRYSQLREKLVKNETLAMYSTHYGLDKRARFPPEFSLLGRTGANHASGRERQKVLGDIFESYVAAAILGDPDGLSRVVPWLKSVWASTLSKEINAEHRAQMASLANAPDGNNKNGNGAQTDLNPKVLLAKKICSKEAKVFYEDDGHPGKQKGSGLPLYNVCAYLNGWGETRLLLGHGSALSKKEAGLKAAQRALENKKLIKKFEAKKADFLAALEAQKPPA